jgi:orotidine-5'-phosphate decarboxylase
VGIVKPQVAFFERHGSAGYAALEATIAAAREADLIVISDAKRGDLGTSVEAYAQAWLTPGAPLEADAMTVSAFQGVGSLSAPMALAREHGKGLFVLAATSNPESIATQTAVVAAGDYATQTVAASIVAEVNKSNSAPLGSFGVVIGATVSLADFGLTASDLALTPILAPGFGFQGAHYSSLSSTYGEASANAVVSSSRGILEAGPGGIAQAIASQAADLRGAWAR